MRSGAADHGPETRFFTTPPGGIMSREVGPSRARSKPGRRRTARLHECPTGVRPGLKSGGRGRCETTVAHAYGITYASGMTAISATTARANLYHLIDQVNADSEPLTITGQRGNAVLIGESDWRAIQETLFLESVPGFTESIRQARAAGVQEGSTELGW